MQAPLCAKKRVQFGFTLIELMVVMVLLGLLVSVAITNIGSGNQKRELDNEATRLFGVMRMAADEAVFTNTEIGLLIEDNQYSFLAYDEDEGTWDAAGQSFLRSHEVPEWIQLSYNRDGQELSLRRRQSNDDEDNTPDLQREQSKTPDIWLLSSGDLTPFDITLTLQDDSEFSLVIKTDEDGEIILPRAGEDS